MPLRHGGVDAGYLFLADKEGAFTEEDEAVLLQVASYAAAPERAAAADAPWGGRRQDACGPLSRP